jgi:nucleoid-associated protein YgaU
MRNELKIAMVVVLIGVVVSAIYFFSSSDKTIEVKSPQPLTPPAASPRAGDGPVDITPRISVTEKENETIDLFSAGPESGKKPAETKADRPGVDKPLLTINLEPLSDTPTSKPAPSIAARQSDKIEAMESAANKVVPNQPISLDDSLSKFESSKPGVIVLTEEQPGVEKLRAKTHVVKEGETLYQISKTYYGRGDKWQDIARANPRIKPERIRAGDELLIPDLSGKAVAAKKSDVKPTGTQRTYKVRDGDTLELIAQEQLGDPSRWKEILTLNKSKLKNDPRNLRADSTILLPEK